MPMQQGDRLLSSLVLPRRTGFDFASARPNYDRRSTFFHGRACVGQIAILTVELIGHIAVSSANPAVIKAANCKRPTIGKHEGFRRFINPEPQVFFDARRSTSSRCVCNDYLFCWAV